MNFKELPRHCWFRVPVAEMHSVRFKLLAGVLHVWGQEADDHTGGTNPVGVIEAGDGTVHSVYVENICFASVVPTDWAEP